MAFWTADLRFSCAVLDAPAPRHRLSRSASCDAALARAHRWRAAGSFRLRPWPRLRHRLRARYRPFARSSSSCRRTGTARAHAPPCRPQPHAITPRVRHRVLHLLAHRSFDHLLGFLTRYNPAIDGLFGNETNPYDPANPAAGYATVTDDSSYISDPDPGVCSPPPLFFSPSRFADADRPPWLTDRLSPRSCGRVGASARRTAWRQRCDGAIVRQPAAGGPG